ncbi:Tubulin-folding cofactor C [Diplonema papillatum]|nr:Tubulin-folding cofactor C [Diplonema papillatum]
MGCFETKEAPEEKKDKEKGAKKKGASKDPLEKWSYETVEEKPWKMPSKDEFMSRFSTGEDDPAAARKRMLAFLNTKDAKNETKVYLPGELDNFDVTFEGCENCDFYILDLSSQIQVDDCIGCRFFIAPCTGSIFIRNCTNCSVAVAASQVRLRDCKDCVLMLFVPGRSVLEECRGTSVACWNVSYFQLRVQFARARLSIFDNGWWRFNDFGTNSAPRILPAGTSLEDVMRKEEKPWKQLHEIAPGIINAGADVDLAVPLTSGSTPSADACFVLFSPGLSLQASQVALHCSGGKGGDGLDVVACREFGRLGDPEIARYLRDTLALRSSYQRRGR